MTAAILDVAFTVRRAGVAVVREVAFTVEAGSALGIAGRNGAGKSTLIAGLAGLLLSEGRLCFDGVDIGHLPAHRRARLGVALVPQGRRLFPSLSVADNLRAARLSPPGPGPAIDELELFPELLPLLRRPAGVLSGGQQQQVAIARALIRRPQLILLDEPTEGLAPAVAVTVRDALVRLSGLGVGLVVAEQKPHFIEDLCASFLVLRSGEVAAYDTPGSPAVRAHIHSL